MIGLSGAQRVGKTTLARAFADKHGIPFVQTRTSQVFEEMGLDPKLDYPLDLRLAVQLNILRAIEKQWKEAGSKFISDRTPLDMAAYMLADVQRETVNGPLSGHIAQYVQDCIDATNRHFATILVVQPGIKPKEEKGKAPATPAYTEHIAAIVMGLVCDERIEVAHFFVPRKMMTIAERMACLEIAVERSQLRWETRKENEGIRPH